MVDYLVKVVKESKVFFSPCSGTGRSPWTQYNKMKNSVTDYLKDAKDGKLKVEKRFGIKLQDNDLKKRAICEKLCGAIRIIELFRALDFKSYTDDSYVKINCIIGKTFLDDKIETSRLPDEEEIDRANVTNICPYFVYNRKITYTAEIYSEDKVTEDALRSWEDNDLFKSVDFRSFKIVHNPQASSSVLSYIGKNKLKASVSLTWDNIAHNLNELLLIIDKEARQGLSDVETEISLFIRLYCGGECDDVYYERSFETLEEGGYLQ